MSSRKSSVYDFYKEENHFRCILMNCNKPCQERLTKLKTDGITQNSKHHLKRKHEKEHMQEEADKNSKFFHWTNHSFWLYTNILTQGNHVNIKEDFIFSTLKIVCYNGVPLTFFSDQGFKLMNGKLAQSLGVVLG